MKPTKNSKKNTTLRPKTAIKPQKIGGLVYTTIIFYSHFEKGLKY